MKIRRRQLFFFLHFGQHQSPRITTLVSMQLRHPTFQMGASFEEALTGAESLGPVLLLKAVVNSVTFRSFLSELSKWGELKIQNKSLQPFTEERPRSNKREYLVQRRRKRSAWSTTPCSRTPSACTTPRAMASWPRMILEGESLILFHLKRFQLPTYDGSQPHRAAAVEVHGQVLLQYLSFLISDFAQKIPPSKTQRDP